MPVLWKTNNLHIANLYNNVQAKYDNGVTI